MIELVSRGNLVMTRGLAARGRAEFAVNVSDDSVLPSAEELLRNLCSYEEDGMNIRSGETMRYGYWMLRFEDEEGQRVVWERSRDGSTFVSGADFALRCWDQQHSVCNYAKSEFAPPRPDQLVAISEGVLGGGRVSGERSRAPDHMSGWYFWTDDWNEDIGGLELKHLFHVTDKRVDLVPYIALPAGFRFEQQPNGPAVISFDEDAVEEE